MLNTFHRIEFWASKLLQVGGMIFIDMLFAFLAALLVLAVLWAIQPSVGMGNRKWLARCSVFVVIFLVIWAGGLWINPVGPPWWGSPWLSFLLVACVLGLVAAAFLAARPGPSQAADGTAVETDVGISVGIFFWLLLLVLIVAIAVRYAWPTD